MLSYKSAMEWLKPIRIVTNFYYNTSILSYKIAYIARNPFLHSIIAWQVFIKGLEDCEDHGMKEILLKVENGFHGLLPYMYWSLRLFLYYMCQESGIEHDYLVRKVFLLVFFHKKN